MKIFTHKLVYSLLLVLLSWGLEVKAEETVLLLPFQFNYYPPQGSRSFALGGTSSTLLGEVSGIFTNPSLLMGMRGKILGIEFSYLGSSSIDFAIQAPRIFLLPQSVALILSLRNFSLGLGYNIPYKAKMYFIPPSYISSRGIRDLYELEVKEGVASLAYGFNPDFSVGIGGRVTTSMSKWWEEADLVLNGRADGYGFYSGASMRIREDFFLTTSFHTRRVLKGRTLFSSPHLVRDIQLEGTIPSQITAGISFHPGDGLLLLFQASATAWGTTFPDYKNKLDFHGGVETPVLGDNLYFRFGAYSKWHPLTKEIRTWYPELNDQLFFTSGVGLLLGPLRMDFSFGSSRLFWKGVTSQDIAICSAIWQ